VFTRKIDGATGQPTSYKTREVAKDSSQIPAVDYNELYASVVHKDTFRVFLSLVAHLNQKLDQKLDQIDITAAFLNGNLEEKIYLRVQRVETFWRIMWSSWTRRSTG
jgi:hypothetical protein